MPQSYRVVVSFEMADGRELTCEYGYAYYPATWNDPADSEVGDPTYRIEGEEVEYDKLPKGLNAIADAMYEADAQTQRFGYNETSVDIEPDYDEPEYD